MLAGGVCNVALAWWMSLSFHAYGAAVAIVASNLLLAAVAVFQARRLVGATASRHLLPGCKAGRIKHEPENLRHHSRPRRL